MSANAVRFIHIFGAVVGATAAYGLAMVMTPDNQMQGFIVIGLMCMCVVIAFNHEVYLSDNRQEVKVPGNAMDRFIQASEQFFELCNEEQARDFIVDVEGEEPRRLVEALWLIERLKREIKAKGEGS